jgi:hypothetical protein
VAGVAGAVGSAAVVAVLWNGGLAAEGLAAAAGETAGFYCGFIIPRLLDTRNRLPWWRRLIVTATGAAVEFGPAEAADSLLLRPGAMIISSVLIGNAFAGILVGKAIADIAFYGLAIASYETLIRPRAKRAT